MNKIAKHFLSPWLSCDGSKELFYTFKINFLQLLSIPAFSTWFVDVAHP